MALKAFKDIYINPEEIMFVEVMDNPDYTHREITIYFTQRTKKWEYLNDDEHKQEWLDDIRQLLTIASADRLTS